MTYTAKLYHITCSCCNKKYVGSCRNRKGLSNRMYNHRSDCKKGRTSKLYTHMREKGFEYFTISLLEEVEVTDIDEQRKLEQNKIEELDTINNGLNSRRAYASKEVKNQQKKESDRKYNSNNRITINIAAKKYRAGLNIIRCECCNYETRRPDTFKRHLSGGRHIKKHQKYLESK